MYTNPADGPSGEPPGYSSVPGYPAQGAYPPAAGYGCPPQNAGYPGYPAQPTGYPAQPAGYPAQPGGFPAQPVGCPAQPGYAPQPGGYPVGPAPVWGYPTQGQPGQSFPPAGQAAYPGAPPTQPWGQPSPSGFPGALPNLKYESSRELADSSSCRSEVQPQPFNDEGLFQKGMSYLTGMKIYIRRWDGRPVIGGIRVMYSSGCTVLHGSDNFGYENHEFTFGPGEFINSVSSRAGWLIDSLSFRTNTGRLLGVYGGTGGDEIHISPSNPGAYLAYLEGRVDVTQNQHAIRHLKFVWACSY